MLGDVLHHKLDLLNTSILKKHIFLFFFTFLVPLYWYLPPKVFSELITITCPQLLGCKFQSLSPPVHISKKNKKWYSCLAAMSEKTLEKANKFISKPEMVYLNRNSKLLSYSLHLSQACLIVWTAPSDINMHVCFLKLGFLFMT